MLYELLAGFSYGLITSLSGLIPSLHINNILPVLSSQTLTSGVAIVVGSVLFTFSSVISSFLFFIPSESNFVSLMPSQRLYYQGKAYYAIYLACTGALYAVVFGLPFIILFVLTLQFIKPILVFLTPFVLIFTLIFLLFSVKNILGIFAIGFSSLLGWLVLQSSLDVANPLFVLITGLFGLSAIYFAVISGHKTVKQTFRIYKPEFLKLFYISLIANILSIFVTLFPGIGSGIATYFGVKTSQLEKEDYIMLNGAINILVIILSLFAAAEIGSTRTGSAYWFKAVAENTILQNKLILVFLISVSIGIGFILTLFLAKKIILILEKINQKKICIFALCFLCLSVLLFSNILGFFVFLLSGLIGVFTIKTNNPRILMLSVIIFPVLIWFL